MSATHRAVTAFLSLSGLSRFNLRVILFTARGTHASDDTATVSRAEFYTAVRLVQLRQNGLTATSDFDATATSSVASRRDGSGDERVVPLRPAYFHTVSGTSMVLPPLYNPIHEIDGDDDDALILRLPAEKRKATWSDNHSAPNQHRRAHSSFHIDLDLPSEERSPSLELERRQQAMLDRQSRLSLGSEADLDDEASIAVNVCDGDFGYDCPRGMDEAEERDD